MVFMNVLAEHVMHDLEVAACEYHEWPLAAFCAREGSYLHAHYADLLRPGAAGIYQLGTGTGSGLSGMSND